MYRNTHITNISHLSNLEELRASYTNISDQTITYLKKLKILDISFCPKIKKLGCYTHELNLEGNNTVCDDW